VAEIIVRPAVPADLGRIVEIYNHYVIHTPITFTIEPVTVETFTDWFREHTAGGRHQLFVADYAGRVLGFAGTGRFRDRAAYDTTAEVTVYCAPDATGRGLGAMMYRVLFDAIKDADLRRLVAGITLPNDASVALHTRYGFKNVGAFSENGRKFDKYWDVLWMERPLRLG
jgi:phosphinothricin acetyltransferase